jgi:hypothetical protein
MQRVGKLWISTKLYVSSSSLEIATVAKIFFHFVVILGTKPMYNFYVFSDLRSRSVKKKPGGRSPAISLSHVSIISK